MATTIMHPTDFSVEADAAEADAVRLAKALAGEILLLHVAVEPVLYSESVFAMRDVKAVYQAQAQWAERRLRGSDMGLNTVMITGIEGDQVTKRVDETRTTWVLRTPPEPGAYSVAAAFYYGTEKGRPLGTVVRNGRAEPRGGPGGASGRIMFSDVVKINVK